MPELPEVETVKLSLAPALTGRTISKVQLIKPVVVAHPGADDFVQHLTGRQITGINRRGKYVLIELNDGSALVIHLRMTGRLYMAAADDEPPKHTHVIFYLDDGSRCFFNDGRRFGRLWLLAKDEEDTVTGMAKLGPEPFDAAFNAEYLQNKLGKRKVVIKQGLLDQTILAGLGNIYVDETLFRAGISPLRPAGEVTAEEWQKLASVIPSLLKEAIEHRGTSFRDYRDGFGRKGDFLSRLKVYQRKGEPCFNCKTPLERTVVAGRSSFYCLKCQK